MKYIAIIGDIKDSKEIKNRGEVQEKLRSTLEEVNNAYGEDIAANFLITLGDEFQGLLLAGDHLLEMVKLIQRAMYPVKLRIGVGFGEITTQIERNAAIGADGPAFYAARQTIEELHLQEKKLKNQALDMKISLYETQDFQITQINTMLAMLKMIEDSWSEKQRQTIWDMEEKGGNQSECASRMNTTQSSVARRLSDGNYITYENTKEVVIKSIKQYFEQYKQV